MLMIKMIILFSRVSVEKFQKLIIIPPMKKMNMSVVSVMGMVIIRKMSMI